MKKKTKDNPSAPFIAHLNEIVNFLPDATFAINLNGKIIAWNKAIEQMTGVRSVEVIGKGDHEYALPFYGERKPILIDLVFKSNKEIESKYRLIHREKGVLFGETEAARLKGKNVYLWAKASAIKNSQGKIVGAIESIRNITELKKAEETLRHSQAKLKEQTAALQQKNIDLKDILIQVEAEKKRAQTDILNNVESVLLPLLKKMRLKGEARKYIKILQDGLENLVSPFGSKITDKKYHLTPREIEICNMIKNGLSGKEIARLLNIAFQTVEMHRKNIRRKLGLSNKRINLTTFLQDF